MPAAVPQLLPQSSTRAERSLEAATARLGDVPSPLRDLWNPDTCPVALLPWLAWALSIEAWSPDWPEPAKRARVRQAIELQRRKGTAASVRDVVAAFGGGVALREWWQTTPRGDPHTFTLALTLQGKDGAPATSRFVDELVAEISRTKPARSWFTFTTGLQAAGRLAIAAAGRVAVHRRLQFSADTA